MRDGGLGEMDAFFNVSCAQGGRSRVFRGTVTKSLQDAATRGIGNGLKSAVKGLIDGHVELGIARESMSVNVRFWMTGVMQSELPRQRGNIRRELSGAKALFFWCS
jgi:hypothetical protein